jgi:hypothetical protein
MKRYLAAIEGLTPDYEKKFLAYIKENNWGWWHRIDNVWLITDYKETVSVREIRDFLLSLGAPGAVGIVVPVTDDDWAGLGPKASLKETFKWLHDYWAPPSPPESS